ncbi:MAG: S9 family peptidase [Xanthomonadaceae bacterium]|jgi:dipeptidyl aminopeptidase/acylaminoacyl peptidase|nr:S9 family peptidase [Xanthomonadaceae bacterium]
MRLPRRTPTPRLGLALLATLGGAAIAAPSPTVAPHGSWASPVAAADLARAAVAMSDVRVEGEALVWRESRPAEGGRLVLVRREADGRLHTATPEGFSVRTRVHEYGGSSHWRVGDATVFANFSDQRLHVQRDGAAPVAITPPGFRYADCVAEPARNALLCVREDHTASTRRANGEERNEIVRVHVPAAGAAHDADAPAAAGTVLVTGHDFVAYPRLDPEGARLAWMSWEHPQMPWEHTRIHVAPLRPDGSLGDPQVVFGGDRSVLEPQWDRDGTLYFIDERSGWWNLYAWDGRAVRAVAPMAREFGGPLWQLGMQTYALTGDGRAVARTSLAAVDELGVIDLASGAYRRLDLPFVAFGDVRLDARGRIVTLATPVDDETALLAVDPADGRFEVLHRTAKRTLDRAFVSIGERIEFPTAPGPDGEPRTAHATFYPPVNPGFRGPEGEKPILIVLIHGGPTSVSKPTFALSRQFWTSRGFALVDVNYGGSTTFGRDYRRRLNGQWGVVDVQDAVAAVDFLVAQGKADPARVAIRGGSAGGFTTLAALAFTDRFRAGANLFGVSDIQALAATSHKFERLYDVSLVGPPDEALYRARSPLFHLEGFTEPLITFQGDEDRIVPPEQSRAIVAALDRQGVMHAYFEFAGEQHGFRKAENIIRAQEAELAFYGAVFGFIPADTIAPFEIRHRRPPAD